MFLLLGKFVSRFWLPLLCAWVLLLGLTWAFAPDWEAVTQAGEVQFLPATSPSRRGEELFRQAFPDEFADSTIALVLVRSDGPLGMRDRKFVQDVLTPALADLATTDGDNPVIMRIRSLADEGAGAVLISPDKQATLVVLELNTPFQDRRSDPVVDQVEQLVARLGREGKIPAGLDMYITGSATAGRDLTSALDRSAQAIQTWTIGIVIGLLLLMYRAPLVALIPLVTVAVAVKVSVGLLTILAGAGWVILSRDLGVFITVLAYGAGVDYCLFLLARYHEELEGGLGPAQALADAVGHVGAAVTASAATVIGGIAMLAFAHFGKIHEAGLIIPIALGITLAGVLTFSTSLLRLFGPCAFWPQPAGQKCVPGRAGELAGGLLMRWNLLPNLWQNLGPALLRRPGLILVSTLALMTPFVIVALGHYTNQNYNPLSELPTSMPSVIGTRAVEKHFSPGILGPVTVFLKSDRVDFSSEHGIALIDKLTTSLRQRRDELELADVRSLAQPLGISAGARETIAQLDMPKKDLEPLMRERAVSQYVSRAEGLKGHVTRLDLMFTTNPLSQRGIGDLGRLEQELPALLPPGLAGAQVLYAGSSANVYDLSLVKQGDQDLVQVLVSLVVFILLLVVLRRVVISVYLILSVLFSYLATLGMTFIVFWLFEGPSFAGLDWKVPIFLFTILVAVGEDYNIFLLSRVQEEQRRHGLLRGVPIALAKTGRVISSCGLLMAGTFASLLSGSLTAMRQLGFALAFGVLLDTMVVRPILVPTFLIVLQGRWLGRLGRHMAFGSGARAVH